MEIKAHFSDIHEVIIDQLRAAETDIVAAIAWFTDRDIFDVLCAKARDKVRVSVVTINDDINQGPGGLNFRKLSDLGGEIHFLPSEGSHARMMHHKFCVIDGASVITGSYNWSRKARSNDENVTVITQAHAIGSSYLEVFAGLVARAGGSPPAPSPIAPDDVRRRLELIRNLLLLGEQDELGPHLGKLRRAADAMNLGPILAALESENYVGAVSLIDERLTRAFALVASGQAEVARLRFELSVLELRLESISDEKAEAERLIITFNRRHDEVLGEDIEKLLMARAELARLLASHEYDLEARARTQQAAEEAESLYEDYSRQHEIQRDDPPLPSLTSEEESELKSLYRKACALCHPDKVPEAQKDVATSVFLDLQAAYQSNDLERVRQIYTALLAGGVPDIRSAILTEAEELKAAIAEMEASIARLCAELAALHSSDGYRQLLSAGTREALWQAFFERQGAALASELERTHGQIRAVHTSGDRAFDGATAR